ncbi:hypothetical protein [Kitasatospora sp. NPDC018619]|uniref:hypothetical protein n=1 Tax=unclassified Kitasatospora TaxID=2633591 RepID=UPI0037A6D644
MTISSTGDGVNWSFAPGCWGGGTGAPARRAAPHQGRRAVDDRRRPGVGRAYSDQLLRRLQDVNTPVALLSWPPSEGTLFGSVKPRRLPPGRARYVTRRRTVQVQTGLLPEPAEPPA